MQGVPAAKFSSHCPGRTPGSRTRRRLQRPAWNEEGVGRFLDRVAPGYLLHLPRAGPAAFHEASAFAFSTSQQSGEEEKEEEDG